MTKERFILQPSQKPGFWVATDTEHGIVITFREHEFNEMQKITLLDDNTFDSHEGAVNVATSLREIADWLCKEHYNVAMPSVIIQRKTMGASIRTMRMRRGLAQEELARKAGITCANLANIEAGKYSAGLDVLNKIANALGVRVEIR